MVDGYQRRYLHWHRIEASAARNALSEGLIGVDSFSPFCNYRVRVHVVLVSAATSRTRCAGDAAVARSTFRRAAALLARTPLHASDTVSGTKSRVFSG